MSINSQAAPEGRGLRTPDRLRAATVVMVLAAVLASPDGSAIAWGAAAGIAGPRSDRPRAAGAASALPRADGPVPGARAAVSGGADVLAGRRAGDLGAVGGIGQGGSAAGQRAPSLAPGARSLAPGARSLAQGAPSLAQGASTLGQGVPVAGQGAVAGPRVVARAAILADESTGQVLFERNSGVPRAMASTTKVMTALLALERLDERRVVVIGPGPPQVGEESLRLRRGERLTVRQLLLGLLVKSANDAAVALAEAVDGGEAAFVRRMNRKAATLRLGATRYVTPYGLDRPGHQTSARDLARLWEVAMRRADFRALVATRAARLPGGPLSLRRFVTTNELLGSYRWTVGGKTGFTNRAGRCLVASASRGGRRLVAVALGSPNAFADVRTLFEYGFSKYVRVRLAQRGQPVSVAPDRPAALQAGTDVDALVRLDQLTKVRLLAPGLAGQDAGTGASPGTGGSSGPATSGASGPATSGASGPVGGGSGGGTSAWFVAPGRRLVRVSLVRSAGGGPPPTSTPAVPAPSTGAAAGGAGTGGPTGGTLVAGTAVRVWPVPPGAPAPTIDPLLRRAPP
jgi:serine-type D-Ala-D-Ala carboxypeptidase (penicillin-binding protein 5/6)